MTNSINATQFVDTLHERINAYFSNNNISTKSDSVMIIKIVTSSLLWVLSYFAIFLATDSKWAFFALYIFHGMSHIYFSFTVGHDALHNAISKNKAVNNFWAYSYDLLGVSSYMWRFMHHQGHHSCLNIHGEDMSLETTGILRLSTEEKRKKIHKYQHIYAFFIYGLYLLYYVFAKDFKYFFSKNNLYLKNTTHSTSEWIKLFLGKIFYLSYMLILPIYLLPFDWYFIFFTFCLTLFMIGVRACLGH